MRRSTKSDMTYAKSDATWTKYDATSAKYDATWTKCDATCAKYDATCAADAARDGSRGCEPREQPPDSGRARSCAASAALEEVNANYEVRQGARSLCSNRHWTICPLPLTRHETTGASFSGGCSQARTPGYPPVPLRGLSSSTIVAASRPDRPKMPRRGPSTTRRAAPQSTDNRQRAPLGAQV
jgi:hypothetical protein